MANQRGFALVIALVLMAFLLLLMVSISTFTMVEVRATSLQQDMALARQNALFGLRMALVQLQEEAGPDQRATAFADIMMDGENAPVEGKRYWTGVWRTDVEADPVWLVSRLSPDSKPFDPFTGPEHKRIKIVGEGSATVEVMVDLLPVPGTDSNTAVEGRYGYWIGDESVKAKVNLIPDLEGNENHRHALLSAQRFGVENIGGLEELEDYLVPSKIGDHVAAVQNIHSYGDLWLLNDTLGKAALRQSYFDLTTYSYGVLSNSRDGGLREDLTYKLGSSSVPEGYVFPEDANRPENRRVGPEWRLLWDYYQLSKSISGLLPVVKPRFEHSVMTRGDSLAGSVYGDHASSVNITPLPVFTGLTFGLSLEPEGEETYRLQLVIKPVVALWNPYDVALDSDSYMVEFYPEDNPRTIHQRTPAVVLRNVSSNATNWTVHINELLPGYKGTNSNSSPENNLHFYVNSGILQPGEIRWYSLPAGTAGAYAEGMQLNPGFRPDAYVAVPVHSQAGYRNGTGWAKNLGIDIGEVKKEDVGASNIFGLGPNIGRYGVRWHFGTHPIAEVTEDTVFHYTRVTGRSGGPFTMAIAQPGVDGGVVNLFPDIVSTGVILYGPHRTDKYMTQTLEDSGLKVIANYNVRSLHHTAMRDDSSMDTGIAWRTDAPTYGQISVNGGALAFDEDFLWESNAMTNGTYRIILFHLPREPIFSVGQFQHLNVSRSAWEPTYAIGNSLASPWVEGGKTENNLGDWTLYDTSYLWNDFLWDRYFFSTWDPPDSELSPNGMPGNPRMQVWSLPEEVQDRAAAHLLVDGPFNVNSTSVEAWKAFLSGLNRQAILYRDAVNEETIEAKDLENPFFRTPYPGGGAADYWRGYRELSEEQLSNLAGQIVHQVRKRGPFLTLGQFVNRSLNGEDLALALKGTLQAAIDSTESVVVDGITYDPPAINPSEATAPSVSDGPSSLKYAFPEAAKGVLSQNATGYLTQADLLSALGATMTTRSDTFVVRAYGDVVNPLWGDGSPAVTARAWCEAVVQRVPEYVDPGQDPFDLPSGINAQLGRRFKIISFRWLSPDEV